MSVSLTAIDLTRGLFSAETADNADVIARQLAKCRITGENIVGSVKRNSDGERYLVLVVLAVVSVVGHL